MENYINETVRSGAVLDNGIVSITVKENSVDIRDSKTDEGFRLEFKRGSPSGAVVQKYIDWVKRAKSYKQAAAAAKEVLKEASKIDREANNGRTMDSSLRKQPRVKSSERSDPIDERPVKNTGTSISSTILHQLGGNKFIMMTGAKNMATDGSNLRFKLPKAKDGINYVEIKYVRGKDTYDMIFSRVTTGGKTGYRNVKKKEYTDIYADQLGTLFEKTTGLRTRLF